MSVDHKDNYFHSVRSALSFVVAPIQYVVDWPVQAADWVKSSFSSHRALVKENQHLKAQSFLLNVQLQRLLSLERENSQLRALLKSSTRAGGKVLAAQLLAVDSDPFIHEVVLDKGVKAGIYVGQPVIDASGVMGQVIQVGPVTSRVLLIDDSRSAVPVQVNRNGVRAIVTGRGVLGGLTMIHVPETTDVKAGDVLVTSGLGQHFPIGYPVGVVRYVAHDPGQAFATIQVAPSAHLNRSRQVLLVWPNKQPSGLAWQQPAAEKQEAAVIDGAASTETQTTTTTTR